MKPSELTTGDLVGAAAIAATQAYTFNPGSYTYDVLACVLKLKTRLDVIAPEVWIEEVLQYHDHDPSEEGRPQ
jgi:hypothetical protein